MKGIHVGPLLLAAAGLVLIWSAVHGANVSTTLRDILATKGPAM